MCEYTSTKKRHIHILVQSEKIWADSIFCVGSARIFFDSIVRWKWSFFSSLNTLSICSLSCIHTCFAQGDWTSFFFSTHLIFGFYTHFVVLRCLWQNRRWRKNIFFVFIIIMCDGILATFWKLFFFCLKSSLNKLLINFE